MKMNDFTKLRPRETLEGYTVTGQMINKFGDVVGIILKDPEICGIFASRHYALYFGEDTEIGGYD